MLIAAIVVMRVTMRRMMFDSTINRSPRIALIALLMLVMLSRLAVGAIVTLSLMSPMLVFHLMLRAVVLMLVSMLLFVAGVVFMLSKGGSGKHQY
jgi:hypothetical protein